MPICSTAALDELVTRFQRQRPLRGGSLIVTLFGDALLPRGGVIALGSLITLAEPFGLNERLVRTASGRLVKEGWLEARRAGKRSEYHLSKNGRARFAEATKRIYGNLDSQWSGRWTMLIVPPMRAADKKTVRDELIWRGFGEVSRGVFAHPEIDSRSLGLHRATGPLSKVLAVNATLEDANASQRLVALGWDLAALSERYRRFVKRFERVADNLRAPDSLSAQDCFMVRTLLIHEYRRLHLRDPLLPSRLLRPNWPGVRAAELCRYIYSRVFASSETHITHVATRLQGALPPAEASVMQRFGGISAAITVRQDV